MNKSRKIARKNLALQFPITGTIAWGLLLERLHTPGWVWGVIGTLAAIVWIVSIIAIFWAQETVDITPLLDRLEEKPERSKP